MKYLVRLKSWKLSRDQSCGLKSRGYRHYNVLSTVKFHFIKIIWCFQAPHSWGQPSNLIIFLAMIIGSRVPGFEFPVINVFIHQLLISYHALKNPNIFTYMMITLISKKKLTHSIWQIQLCCPRSKWNMGEILAFLA